MELITIRQPDMYCPDDVDNIRYEVEVADPIAPNRKGCAYIYTSSTLTPVTTDYVGYSGPTTNMIDAWGYEIDFGDNRKRHIMVDLKIKATAIGDNSDFIDRMKNRIEAQVWPFPSFYLTENDMDSDLFGNYQDGRVRVLRDHGRIKEYVLLVPDKVVQAVEGVHPRPGGKEWRRGREEQNSG